MSILYTPKYTPEQLMTHAMRLPDVHSEWRGLERVLPDILERFNVYRGHALEFGVWYGFSTAVFANFFRSVTGVDTFTGDAHAGFRDDLLEGAKRALFQFSNIQLVMADYATYIQQHPHAVDLIHIDIFHDYEPTFELGMWAVTHAPVTLLHDTEAFPAVKEACAAIADATGCEFHNYPECHGLGILVTR